MERQLTCTRSTRSSPSATTFRDDIGFIKRTGVRKHFVDFGVRHRPECSRKFGIRELHPHARTTSTPISRTCRSSHTNHVAMRRVLRGRRVCRSAVEPAVPSASSVPFKVRPDQVVRARLVQLERVRRGARDQSQPENLGIGAGDDRRLLDRHAADGQGGRGRQAVPSPHARSRAAAE